jgi:hypothetical protein
MISGFDALRNMAHPKASWASARRRIRYGLTIPLSAPSFQLKTTDTIMTLGSCFARNVEERLAKNGCRVPGMDFVVPENERVAERAIEILNLFCPPLFRQEIEWAATIYDRDGKVTPDDCASTRFDFPDGRATDLGLARISPTSRDRHVERRKQLYELYANAFTADCVIITPGLVEAWFDSNTGRYVNTTPMIKGKLIADHFAVRVLGYQECFNELKATVEIIRARNPKAKFIISLSPIPLRYTFTQNDVVTANNYSKSVLGAVCQDLANELSIDYYPSFEAAMHSRGVWASDRRHVAGAFVSKLIGEMERRYFSSAPSELPSYASMNFIDRLRARFFSPSRAGR